MKKEVEIDQSIFSIDQLQLDKEWSKQSKLYFDWAEQLAEARTAYDKQESVFEVVQAELDKKIRAEPEKYVDKATEASIKNAIILQPEYQDADRILRKKKHDMRVLEAAVTALDHKKKALEKMVDLLLSNYYSDPRPPKGMEDRVSGMEKRTIRKAQK